MIHEEIITFCLTLFVGFHVHCEEEEGGEGKGGGEGIEGRGEE